MGWCIFIIIVLLFTLINVSVKYDICKTESEKTIKELKQTVENLKDADFVRKEKRIMDAQLRSLDCLTTYKSIRVDRIPLGNLVRAFKSSYVWLQLKDLITLEITDGSSTVTLKCTPEGRKELN